MDPVDEALDTAHRMLFGRLVGWLFRKTGDLQLAEDATAAAFAAAVRSWRDTGVPDSPEAWLRVAARNHAMNMIRSDARTTRVPPEAFDDVEAEPTTRPPLDDRLGLMFVCAHPAIDPAIRAPLMLQAILGVDAARIASVFLVPPSTMGQRLSRAKAKIRTAGIRFRLPEAVEFSQRLAAVLQAIYGAYGVADDIAGADDARDGELRSEAIRLAHLITEVLPTEPEGWGLHALLLHTESRRPARFVGGRFVPLAHQDTALWSPDLRRMADQSLARASTLNRMGRFQLEAAISAIHSSAAEGLATDWDAVVVLYGGLLKIAPSVGATVGAAGAMIEFGQPDEAAHLLDSLPEPAIRSYQPYWVCRFQLARTLGDERAAATAVATAIGLTTHPAVRQFLIDESRRGLT